MDDFNPEKQLTAINQIRSISRRRSYRTSKLNKFRTELVRMNNAGGTLGDLQVWLRSEKKVTAERSTILRYLRSLPESNKFGGENG